MDGKVAVPTDEGIKVILSIFYVLVVAGAPESMGSSFALKPVGIAPGLPGVKHTAFSEGEKALPVGGGALSNPTSPPHYDSYDCQVTAS